MSIINQFFQWLNSYFYSREENKNFNEIQQHLPPIKFNCINIVEHPPKNVNVDKDTLYLVSDGKKHKWTLFQCPCGCRHVITLSLQLSHSPNWKLTQNTRQRATLYPSIWQSTTCFSHFWLKDGRIYWCPDSGTPSWQENLPRQ